MTVKITGMRTVTAKPNFGGSRIIAHFDFITDDLGMRGCVLSLNPEGKPRVWTPLIDATVSQSERKSAPVQVYWRKEGELHGQVLDAAVAMYRLFDGGTIPDENPEDDGLDSAAGLRRFLNVMEAV